MFNKLTKYFISHKFFSISLFFSFISIIYIFSQINTTSNPKLFTTKKGQVTFQQDIIPGKTTNEEVIKKLGEPKNIVDYQDSTILNYPTQQKWDNQVFIKTNKVFLVTELSSINNPLNKTDYFKEFGPPELVLYGPLSPTRNLYLYLSKGFGFLGSENDLSIFQNWYFTPSTKDVFLSQIAIPNNYSEEKPIEGE